MTENKTKKREMIKDFYKDFHKKHLGKYIGAYKIDDRLSFDPGHNNFPTHDILLELVKEGYLKQNKGSGFRLKKK